jgi:hypothetical protein
LWRESFDYLINTGRVKDKISVPENLAEVEYCPITETLSCKACAGFQVKQVFNKENMPLISCTNESFVDALRQKRPEYFKSEQENNDQNGFEVIPISIVKRITVNQ